MNVNFPRLLGAFAIYFVCCLLPPLLLLAWVATTTQYLDVSLEFTALSYLLVIGSICGGLGLYTYALFKRFSLNLFGPFAWRPLLVGAAYVSIIIPLALFLPTPDEQMMVGKLHEILQAKLYLSFSLLAFSVAILAPLFEEVLFRGFLQEWLKNKCPKVLAILFTALIFTLFHYEKNNLLLLLPIFITGLVLSYLKEKEHSLLAPIGLHIAFNTCSMLTTFSIHQ